MNNSIKRITLPDGKIGNVRAAVEVRTETLVVEDGVDKLSVPLDYEAHRYLGDRSENGKVSLYTKRLNVIGTDGRPFLESRLKTVATYTRPAALPSVTLGMDIQADATTVVALDWETERERVAAELEAHHLKSLLVRPFVCLADLSDDTAANAKLKRISRPPVNGMVS